MKHIILGADYMKKKSLLNGVFCVPGQTVDWYYRKSLHLWGGNELFEVNFEFKLKKPATKGPSFWLLSKKSFHCPVLNRQYQAEWNAR